MSDEEKTLEEKEMERLEKQMAKALSPRSAGKPQAQANTPQWKRRQREVEAEKAAKLEEEKKAKASKMVFDQSKMEQVRAGKVDETEVDVFDSVGTKAAVPEIDTSASAVEFGLDEDEQARREEERLMRAMSPRGKK